MSISELPLTLKLVSESGEEPLRLDALVREIPNRRFSGRGEWRGRRVFCKIFVAVDRAAKHTARECTGAEALRERDIATAELLHESAVEGPGLPARSRVVLYEWIEGTENLDHLLRANPTESRALSLLRNMADLIGRMHRSGLIQKDLHFANFAIKGDLIHTFDAGSIEPRPAGVTKALALENLAIFFAQMDPGWDSSIPMLLDVYARSAGDELRPELDRLWPRVIKERRRRMERFLEKVLRPCRLTELHGDRQTKVLVSRPDDGPELEALVEQILATPVLRDGLSLRFEDEEIRLRVYDPESQGLLKKNPAKLAWRNAQRLRLEGLPTPAPLAVSWRPGASWFLSRHPTGRSLESVVSTGQGDLDRIAVGVAHILQRLDQLGLRHGQITKRSFLQDEDGEVLITDVEGLEDRAPRAFGATAQTTSDMQTFLRTWTGSEVEKSVLLALQKRGYALDHF